mmetsp:Transcript_11236/g.12107  ORF Transcript_11236/g.12107 Transcript_11236/m.12107 type:complete len:81 (+) Transcript_11236:771-1013(+)
MLMMQLLYQLPVSVIFFPLPMMNASSQVSFRWKRKESPNNIVKYLFSFPLRCQMHFRKQRQPRYTSVCNELLDLLLPSTF